MSNAEKETNDIRIQMHEPTACYQPGQEISGAVAWQKDKAERKSLEVRLIWFTRGKGDRDFEVVDLATFDPLKDQSPWSFHFEAPQYPCSFSAKLISLIWGIEVISFPDHEAAIHEIVVSPTGRELVMQYHASAAGDVAE